jgi:hypothetical protein
MRSQHGGGRCCMVEECCKTAVGGGRLCIDHLDWYIFDEYAM